MIWDEETIRLLRELWAQGISTAEIGRRLRTSKNSVVGKAHRLGLDARQSPIRSIDRAKRAALETAIRRPAFTLPPLESVSRPVEPIAPRRMDETDQRIAAMLHDRMSNIRISKALSVAPRRVQAVRIAIDLPSQPKATPLKPQPIRDIPTSRSDRFDHAAAMFDEPDFDEEDAAPLVEMPTKPLPVSLVPAVTRSVSGRSATSCCWPIGDPGTKAFRFCDDRAVPGRPYCGEHCKIAYVRIRDRREDAA